MKKFYSTERGFSLIELLIVLTLMGIIFGISVPFYRRYVAQTQLNNVAQDLNTKLVTAHNNAVNGVIPKDATGATSSRYYWVVHVHKNGYTWEYETAACALKTNPPNTATEVTNQFSFSFCDRHDYTYQTFPSRFDISYTNAAYSTLTEADIYFEPITGNVAIYDIGGARVDTPTDSSAIDIIITSTDYTQLQVQFHINHQGTIHESN